MTHTPTIKFKRGDSFKLNITVTDPNNAAAIAAAIVLAASEALLVIDELALVTAQEAIPYVEQNEIDAQAAVDAQIILVAIDQATYDATIIVNIDGWTITSSLRWCGKLITNFVITIISAPAGTLTVTAATTVSELWNEREHKMDIHFVNPSGATSSETMIVDVERGPTNG